MWAAKRGEHIPRCGSHSSVNPPRFLRVRGSLCMLPPARQWAAPEADERPGSAFRCPGQQGFHGFGGASLRLRRNLRNCRQFGREDGRRIGWGKSRHDGSRWMWSRPFAADFEIAGERDRRLQGSRPLRALFAPAGVPPRARAAPHAAHRDAPAGPG